MTTTTKEDTMQSAPAKDSLQGHRPHAAPIPERDEPDDGERLELVLKRVRQSYPDARHIIVSSSDQSMSGYVLDAVLRGTHGELVPMDDRFKRLDEDTQHDLSWLLWGVFGDREDESTVLVDVMTGMIVRGQKDADGQAEDEHLEV